MRFQVPLTVSVDVGTPDPALTTKQRARLFQVFVVGPLMVYGGVRAKGFAGFALALLGIGTVVQRARQYQADRSLAVAQSSLPPSPTTTNLPTTPPSA